ncbi:hypothetical protein KKG19_05470 [Patescibacteria group bacterium]|nr:hypothetical protein [Patescibacteria group bacterium]
MLPEKAITEYMDIYEKKYGKKLTKEEAEEQARSLCDLFSILYDMDLKERRRKAKLTDRPKGYHLDDGETYNCQICRVHIQNQATWYDKNGIKCLTCQKALDKKIIPASVCHDKDSWYALYEFEYYFNIKPATIRKLVRQGRLKARIIQTDIGTNYFYMLLIKDNSGILPPKPESYLVTNEQGMTHVEYKKVDTAKLEELVTNSKTK